MIVVRVEDGSTLEPLRTWCTAEWGSSCVNRKGPSDSKQKKEGSRSRWTTRRKIWEVAFSRKWQDRIKLDPADRSFLNQRRIFRCTQQMKVRFHWYWDRAAVMNKLEMIHTQWRSFKWKTWNNWRYRVEILRPCLWMWRALFHGRKRESVMFHDFYLLRHHFSLQFSQQQFRKLMERGGCGGSRGQPPHLSPRLPAADISNVIIMVIIVIRIDCQLSVSW